jgi:hypothetical protein
MNVPSFLNKALNLFMEGKVDSGLDVLFEGIDVLMRAEDKKSIRECFSFAKKQTGDLGCSRQVDFGIGVLTATLPVMKTFRLKRLILKSFLRKKLLELGEDPGKNLMGL